MSIYDRKAFCEARRGTLCIRHYRKDELKFNSINIATGLLVLAGLLSISWWLVHDPVDALVTTQPGLDNRGAKAVIPDIEIGDYFEAAVSRRS